MPGLGPAAEVLLFRQKWPGESAGKKRKMDPPLPTTAGAGSTTVGDDGGAGKTRVEDEVRRIGVVGKSLRIADNTAEDFYVD